MVPEESGIQSVPPGLLDKSHIIHRRLVHWRQVQNAAQRDPTRGSGRRTHGHVRHGGPPRFKVLSARVLGLRGGAMSVICDRCRGIGIIFECRRWPECGCMVGNTNEACPGRSSPCLECSPADIGKDAQPRPSRWTSFGSAFRCLFAAGLSADASSE